VKNGSSFIWAFDFDGTISSIVSDRSAARLDPECQDLLADLSADPNQVVAIVSSRHIDDLRSRVPISDVVLAGSSGLEWIIPGGQRIAPNDLAMDRLGKERARILPGLKMLESIEGVEIEDKEWSVAVHYRKVADAQRSTVADEIGKLKETLSISPHFGPDVAEVQFLPDVSKEIAVKLLSKMFKSKSRKRPLVFAGDDQNDAQAMQWVLSHGGSAYVVGGHISVLGAQNVGSPSELARTIRRWFQTSNRQR